MESDIEEEDEDEDVFDAPVTKTAKIVNCEHSDPNSYSWLVLRLATLRIVQHKINEFLAVMYYILSLNSCFVKNRHSPSNYS